MIGHEDKISVEDRGYTSPCHVWTARLSDGGYGMVRDGKRVRTAHKTAYEVVHGPVPAGLTLDHLCRVRACCNAEHLEPVTMAENLRRGACTKLTPADIAAIRVGRVEGVSNLELAERFGVSASWISRIITGRTVNRSGVSQAWATT